MTALRNEKRQLFGTSPQGPEETLAGIPAWREVQDGLPNSFFSFNSPGVQDSLISFFLFFFFFFFSSFFLFFCLFFFNFFSPWSLFLAFGLHVSKSPSSWWPPCMPGTVLGTLCRLTLLIPKASPGRNSIPVFQRSQATSWGVIRWLCTSYLHSHDHALLPSPPVCLAGFYSFQA